MRNLTVIIATDERGGMIFNKRRVSRDRLMIADFMESFTGKIYISEYSKLLFEAYSGRTEICDNPLSEAPSGAVCFIEFPPVTPYLSDISRFVIYNWNRRYPFDACLDVSPKDVGFKLVSASEFVGSSHEKITKEIFEK